MDRDQVVIDHPSFARFGRGETEKQSRRFRKLNDVVMCLFLFCSMTFKKRARSVQ